MMTERLQVMLLVDLWITLSLDPKRKSLNRILQYFSVVKCFVIPWLAAFPSIVLLPLGLMGRVVEEEGKGQVALQSVQYEAHRAWRT